MSENKIIPTLRKAEQPKEKWYHGVKIVAQRVYTIGQAIVDGITYAGTSTKEEHDKLSKKLKNKKN